MLQKSRYKEFIDYRMKDRIKLIMDNLQMTQQTFAGFLNISPASLSSIFNGRTKPTMNIVEAIKEKMPSISTDWLIFGTGSMYVDDAQKQENSASLFSSETDADLLNFEDLSSALPEKESSKKDLGAVVKIIDKPQRKITEIRIFYDDQTWESFSPEK